MDSKTYFVPVDFTECSYRAVQYAVLVAKMFGDEVRLFHVINIDDIPESDNPVVMSRMIDQLRTKAESRMRSFCEMLSEINRVHVCHAIAVGHVENTLMKEIGETKPDVVFFGRGNTDITLIRRVLPRLKIPAFIVPSSGEIHAPSKIALVTDLRPVPPAAMEFLADMVREGRQVLSLVYFGQNRRKSQEPSEKWLQHFIAKCGGGAVFVTEKSAATLTSLTRLTQSISPDLICVVRRKKSFFYALFDQNISVELALNVTIPVLVLSEASRFTSVATIKPVSSKGVEAAVTDIQELIHSYPQSKGV